VSVGDAVYLTSALTVARADADNAAARPPIGVVAGISGSTASVAASGAVASGLSGLTAGAVYWLSTTAGQMTTTQPESNAYVMGVAISETQMLVGTIPAALGGGSLTPTFTSVTTNDMTVLNQGLVTLREATANGTNTVSLRAPAALSSDVTLTLPNSAGTNGQFLSTDGSGNLAWSTGGGGSGSVNVMEFTATTSTVTSSTQIPANATILSVSVQVSTAYSSGATLSLGTPASASLLMTASDLWAQQLGIFPLEVMGLSWASAANVRLTVLGSPAAGAARVRVVYATTVVA
jgi:hypothetical protein